jgi:glycosyltransferase involved in cell wall biosynthesis
VRVYHISSAPFSGGAARAGFRLHEGLLREPAIESIWLDAEGSAHGPSVINLSHPSKPSSLFLRLRRKKWANIIRQHFRPTTPPASNPIGWGSIEMFEKFPKPDVWNLHWVSWFLDWGNLLPWMAEQAPIVWTLHDLNPLRGIWHYEPQPEERTPERLKYEAEAMEIKRRALAKVPKDRITFVGPSKWMVEECRKSPVTAGFRAEHIPYGLDTQIFRARPKQRIREIFGIPESDFVIGFVADSVNDPRKGMHLLMEAIKELPTSNSNLHLIAVGSGKFDNLGLLCTHVGGIHNDVLISHIYSACDVFVCPSTQDNLPNTVLEALACGTPVIGFKVGGLPDLVLPPHNGLLADIDNGMLNLAEKISEAMNLFRPNLEKNFSYSSKIADQYTLAQQAKRYRNSYEAMTK